MPTEMARKPRNHRKPWDKKDINQIRVLARRAIDTDYIAKILGRTPDAVKTKASRKDISLKPRDKKNIK